MQRNNLLYIREMLDFNIETFSALIGVSKSTYSRWETQESFIPVKHLTTISQNYKYSFDYILNLTNKNNYKKFNVNKKVSASRIKEIRKSHNLTQIELAKILNTSHSTISAYENAKTLILPVFAYQLAKKFNLSVDWIYGRA